MTVIPYFTTFACLCVFNAAAESTQPALMTPQIIGDLPDGSLKIEIELPKFTIANKDIIGKRLIEEGGRTIELRKIRPVSLPAPPPAVPSPPLDHPLVQQRLAIAAEESGDHDFMLMGSTVYHPSNGPTCSFVSLHPIGPGEPITFWTSANFALLTGFASFVDSTGKVRSIIMSWSEEDTRIPDLPKFPAGNATFSITAGNPSNASLTAIQSLHDLYNKEYARLLTAYLGRRQAQQAHEAELKANPPEPESLVISYWREEMVPAAAQTQPEGVAK